MIDLVEIVYGLGRLCLGLGILAVVSSVIIALVSFLFELMDSGP